MKTKFLLGLSTAFLLILSGCKQIEYVYIEKEVKKESTNTNSNNNTNANSNNTETAKADKDPTTSYTYDGTDKTSNIISVANEGSLAAPLDQFTLSTPVSKNFYVKTGHTAIQENVRFPVVNEQSITDMPFISVEDFYSVINKDCQANGDNTFITPTKESTKIYKRNNHTLEIDTEKKTIYFSNYNKFCSGSDYDVIDYHQSLLMKKADNNSYFREGKPILFDLGSYNIPMVVIGDTVYFPFQTLNDLFMPSLLYGFIYNGVDFYSTSVSNEENPADASNKSYFYTTGSNKARSSALIDYNYNQLCLYLDSNYGLKEEHGITAFSKYFEQNGIDANLKSTNPKTSQEALAKIIYRDLADFHSALKNKSYYARNENLIFSTSPSYSSQDSLMDEYTDIRSKSSLKDAGSQPLHKNSNSQVYDYREIDGDGDGKNDTAYITFDSFSFPDPTTLYDYYQSNTVLENDFCNDTVGLVVYSYYQIKDNPYIKNVVIDLSCNSGGAAWALSYIAGFILGRSEISIRNNLTGDLSTTVYSVDVNLDDEYNIYDSLTHFTTDAKAPAADGSNKRDFNIFCIISPGSFSCGNALPAILKQSGNVTLIGQTSGGGACSVGPSCTADSTIFQISSNTQICEVKNGSYYQIDKGVTPHVSIPKDKFKDIVYDRTKMTKVINKLVNYEIVNNANIASLNETITLNQIMEY